VCEIYFYFCLIGINPSIEDFPGSIGIDLDTSYSCVGVFQNGKVEIIADSCGNKTMPSYVAFTDIGRLIGNPAKNQAPMNPANTIFGVQRLLGRHHAVENDKKYWPFDLVHDEGKSNIKVNYRSCMKLICAEEISSMVLIKMKEVAGVY